MTVYGIDVSEWQTQTPSLAGLTFLFARATYGLTPDPMYAEHIAAARKAGLVTGAYHFGRHGDVVRQVAAFLTAAGDVDYYALDLESDGSAPPMTQAEARLFLAGVRAAGKRPGLYHSASGFPTLGQDWDWIAAWGSTAPSRTYLFWQYHGGPLDLDRSESTAIELRQHGSSGGSDVRFIASPGYGVTSRQGLPVKGGSTWSTFDGTGSGRFSADSVVPVIGLVDAHSGKYAVLIGTADSDVYPDNTKRPAIVQVQSTAALIDLAGATPASYPVTVGGKPVGSVILP